MSEEKKLKASERLSVIERTIMPLQRRIGELELIVFNSSRDNEVLRTALQLIHKKLDAVITLSNEGSALSKENIDDKIVGMQEQELKDKIQDLLDKEQIEPTEEIGADSVVVGRELKKDGSVENPRIQFVMTNIVEEIKNKLVGQKVGFLMSGEENGLDLEVTEIYGLIKQEEAAPEEAAPAPQPEEPKAEETQEATE